MQAVYTRKAMSGDVPNFEISGYLGSITLTQKTWETAAAIGEERRNMALKGNYQRAVKNPERQKRADLKGAIAEIGFIENMQFIAEVNDLDFSRSALILDQPDATADIFVGGMKFDIKGCAGLVEGFTNRDDKKLIINCKQHDVLYKDYTGYFFVKSYADRQDIFYVSRADVENWEKDPGFPREGGAYYWRNIPKVN